MFFGGGFPFGFAQGGHAQEDDDDYEQQQEQTYYQLLDCSPDAPLKQITEKYQALAEKYGPQGSQPNQQQLELVKQAYAVLSDPDQRANYDASQEGGQANLFNMMFGGQQNQKKGKKNSEKPKMQPTKRVLEVSYEKIYAGGVIDLHHERARLCQACDGKGGQNVKKCLPCKGQGATIELVQMGPGMYSQMEKNCEKCNGLGQLFEQGAKCKVCDGRKITKKEIDLPVKIPIGIPSGEIIKLEGQGNQVPQASAGDLLLVVQQQPHPNFTRKGADLYHKKSISLIEALLGFNFKLTHLDGKEHIIYAKSGEVIGDLDKKIVQGLGMPFYKNEQLRGNLVIEFKVNMPKRGEITPQQLKALSQVLPGTINERPKDSHYEMLQDFDKEHLNSSQQGGKKKQDDEQQGEGGIGCQAQ